MEFNLTLFTEWVGVIMALIYVYLASKGSYWCFLFGLISSAIFVKICFDARLYFDMSINAYYVLMSVIGWIKWQNSAGEIVPVSMPVQRLLQLIIMSLVISMIIGYFFNRYSEASLPFIDSFTTVMAMLATWMMVNKFVENWLIWFFADLISIGMYFYKDHWPMALLFLIYTVISVYGYINWKKKLLHQ